MPTLFVMMSRFQRAKPVIIDPGLYMKKKADVFWIPQRRSVPTRAPGRTMTDKTGTLTRIARAPNGEGHKNAGGPFAEPARFDDRPTC